MLIRAATGFIAVAISREMRIEADIRNRSFIAKYGEITSNTKRLNTERTRVTGYLAEVAIKHAFPRLAYSKSDSYDFLDKYLNLTFDAKAQGCNEAPRLNYQATLYPDQIHNSKPIDYFIFCRVCSELNTVWICGFISKTSFLEKAKLVPAGTVVNKTFKYDHDKLMLTYQDLISATVFQQTVLSEGEPSRCRG